MFITFEGGEGFGKTTQAKILVEALQKAGTPAVFTREPGGTALAEKVRGLILEDKGIDDPLTEFLLITAARHDHVERFIKPQLAEGVVVVCDRFFDSSIVYQGYIKGLNIDLMRKLHKDVFGNFAPDITFLLETDINIAMERISKGRVSNHYDERNITFHSQMHEAFKKCWEEDSKRIIAIDGNQELDVISAEIIARCTECLQRAKNSSLQALQQ